MSDKEMRKKVENEPKQTESDSLPLSPKQREAIVFLISARSLNDACRRGKFSKSTLYAWFKKKTFKSELEKARQEVIDESLSLLRQGVTKAIDKLLYFVDYKEAWISLRASEKILDTYLKFKEVQELESRLEKIERIILERKPFR